MSETSRERNHKLLLELLSYSCCMDCKEDDIRTLTFDHRIGAKKTATVSTLIHKGHPWDIVMREIKKCDVVCLNCHMIRTDERSGSRRQVYREQQQIDNKR